MGAWIAGAAALYVLAGLIIAAAFLSVGIKSVLPPSSGMTRPARVMLLPGVIALWPYVLYRWLWAPAQP